MTIRKNTEWVEIVNNGWNILTDIHTNEIVKARNWMPLPTNSHLKPILGDGLKSRIIKDLIMSFHTGKEA
jgi:UDP-N-acetylglucosamine 2-epimerase